jgi:adenosylcobinamide-phosphate synthase
LVDKEYKAYRVIMIIELLILYYVTILIASVILDLILGEPKGIFINIHPVVLCGKIAYKLFKPGGKHYGVFLWFASVVPIAIIYYLIPRVLIVINIVIGIIVYAYFLKLTFSIKLMRDYAKKIMRSIESGDLNNARTFTQEIVRRNVWELDAAHLMSAVIESLAESLVDGLLSPLFYFALFGLPGALLQRLSNTMDSMVGYRGWPYEDVGWFSAKIDTILNYIPARLSSIVILVASALIGLDWRNSIRIAVREHDNVRSINSGWPMASFAGALGTMLEKVGAYRINSNMPGPDIIRLKSALRLFDVSVIIVLVIILIFLIVRVLLVSLFI